LAGELTQFLGFRINLFSKALLSFWRVMNGRLVTIQDGSENLCRYSRRARIRLIQDVKVLNADE
jgi:hypothetical protein